MADGRKRSRVARADHSARDLGPDGQEYETALKLNPRKTAVDIRAHETVTVALECISKLGEESGGTRRAAWV
jgi:hypothetical protein